MAWYTISFNANGGTLNSTTPLYYNSSGYYWATAKNTGTSYRIYSITKPTRDNYIFNGFWTGSNNNGTQVVGTGGSLGGWVENPFSSTTQTIYAGWVNYATITLSRGIGTGGTGAFYCSLANGKFYSNTALTNEISGITPPTSTQGDFRGYSLNGVQYIDEQGNFTAALYAATIRANYTLAADWSGFGGVVDYFNLASATLVPISSSSGDGKKRTCAANATWSGSTQNGGAGRFSSGVNDIGGIWRNPTVTYMVVGNMTLSLNLGKAYSATKSGSTMTISGWMITSVRVQTAVGKFPTITVSAVANEGANAINLFNVSVSVVARARAQYLMSAVSGGGNLQTCDIEASCTPVVCAENNMPCASDVVGGKYVARATTYAPGGDAAPTAGNGFTSVGEPKACGDKDYPMWSITAEKEIT